MNLFEALERRDELKKDIEEISRWHFKQVFESTDSPKNKELWSVIADFINGLDVEYRALEKKIKESTENIVITE
ncbi:hypothetical protein [Exiguobacterium sp. s133]|uniref:hypothetical protein n=1 Tax=Exiguobacterium sp. s133 TaxID=2751213 RepID=UPI001BEC4B90|nr:hypothetical protein [Exiguobacterium sp. s133]